MQFGEFPVFDSAGVELAYPIVCQGKTFPAGHVVTSDDIRLFRLEGIAKVVGSILASNDLRPDISTSMILKPLVGDFLRYTLPKDGYSEIYADQDGLFIVSPERLSRFNNQSENITLATIPPYAPVYKNQLVASLRLVGPAFSIDVLNETIDKITGQGPLLKIAPYAFSKLGYVQTVLYGADVPKLVSEELNQRFAIYGFNLVHSTVCPHMPEHVEKGVRDAIDAGAEVVVVQSPLPSVNRNDVVPQGFVEAAADIDRLGWPLDPGLPIIFAHKNDVHLVGIAESDFPLPAVDRLMRFLATKSLPPVEEFTSLAQGSMSIERLIQYLTPEQEAETIAVGPVEHAQKIAIVILAAGTSRRMFGTNKLLENIQGLPMIERVVQSALLSKADYVSVVTGYEAKLVEQRLMNYDVKIVRNPDYSAGVLSSMRLGISVLPPDVSAAIILPADMPGFTSTYIDRLIDCYDPNAAQKNVCLPSYGGIRHNPVLWPRELFKVVKIVPEDAYGLPALVEHSDYIVEMSLEDDLPITDINSQGDLSAFLSRADFSEDVEKELLALEQSL